MSREATAGDLLSPMVSEMVLESASEQSLEREPQQADDMVIADLVILAVPSNRLDQGRDGHSDAEPEQSSLELPDSQDESLENRLCSGEDHPEYFDQKRNGHSFAPAYRYVVGRNKNMESSEVLPDSSDLSERAGTPYEGDSWWLELGLIPPPPASLSQTVLPHQSERIVNRASPRLESPQQVEPPQYSFRLLKFLESRQHRSSTTILPSRRSIEGPTILINDPLTGNHEVISLRDLEGAAPEAVYEKAEKKDR
ncbi:hypothetical protein O1611_g2853 [Lasiodiplodia mahajangana]|uniref:Uncharacterized protein n=1 Tax=Lasiodiplodia mahajangana TaxID=1108764 RepID=A0ACC2JTD8_9PEZI|nr:hypothetical protein O1611_g2853 [Lasiodiplodia mahajangana]